jgi:multidrug efflux pump
MRVWLDPEKLAAREMTAGDVVGALREQNVQVAAGRVGQPPTAGSEMQLTINTSGRLLEAEQFDDVIVKTGQDGQVVRLRDVGRSELGAKNYEVASYLDGKPAVTLAVFQMPGTNALTTAEKVQAEMDRLKKRFPDGLDYKIVYDTTVFVDESVHEVYKTLFEAFILVFLVVLLFLQDWRATLLPMIDVPVSLIGTFAVMSVMGFSLNNLSLFGLVLAIGIVVDDAIVVVENIERWMSKGLPVRDATIKAMDEITGPVIAITLVLSSVFIPTAFIAGISGQFYRQFALTIAASTIISAINALTMAPARAVQIFKPHGGEHASSDGHAGGHAPREPMPNWGIGLVAGGVGWWLLGGIVLGMFGFGGGHEGHGSHGVSAAKEPGAIAVSLILFAVCAVAGRFAGPLVNRVLLALFRAFNAAFDVITDIYGRWVGRLLRVSLLVLLVYAGLMGLTWHGFATVPAGFIPEQDKGYLVVNASLPEGASLDRTEEVVRRMTSIISQTEGVAHTIAVPGYNLLNSTNQPNSGGMFVILAPFEERKSNSSLAADSLAAGLRKSLGQIQEARVVVFGAPAVEGLGTTGGFKLQVQDRGDSGPEALQAATANLVQAGNAQPGLVGLFSSFQANQPQLFVDVDRAKAKSLGVPLGNINEALQVYLGAAYVNDITRFGRNWQVNVQADAPFRMKADDIGRLKVRSSQGQMVPLATLVSVREISGPAILNRYNMYPSADVIGGSAPGFSSGQTIEVMKELSDKELPGSMGTEWTELTLLQILAGNTAVFVFALGTLFVFMVLAAQYESWSLPMAIVMIVPMCLLSAIGGVWLTGGDNNIFTQIGLVVLIGLAAKNAILIVEFAKELQEKEGHSRFDAAVTACRVRLRPIIMTSAAFIFGVVPLVLGKGAGAEMRNALGVAVFSGMLGVTFFGIFFTPVFYSIITWFGEPGQAAPAPAASPSAEP